MTQSPPGPPFTPSNEPYKLLTCPSCGRGFVLTRGQDGQLQWSYAEGSEPCKEFWTNCPMRLGVKVSTPDPLSNSPPSSTAQAAWVSRSKSSASKESAESPRTEKPLRSSTNTSTPDPSSIAFFPFVISENNLKSLKLTLTRMDGSEQHITLPELRQDDQVQAKMRLELDVTLKTSLQTSASPSSQTKASDSV